MYVYFCAEVTAIAKVVNLILGAPLWLTAALTIISTLIYSLKGGLKISIITDKFQFLIIVIFLVIIFLGYKDMGFPQTHHLQLMNLE